MGSRGHKYRLKPLPIGNKLKKKDIKKIAKREKYNAKDIITVDNVEDPYGIKHPDHYVREQQNFAMDNLLLLKAPQLVSYCFSIKLLFLTISWYWKEKKNMYLFSTKL